MIKLNKFGYPCTGQFVVEVSASWKPTGDDWFDDYKKCLTEDGTFSEDESKWRVFDTLNEAFQHTVCIETKERVFVTHAIDYRDRYGLPEERFDGRGVIGIGKDGLPRLMDEEE